MKTIYLECNMGVSGTMLLGALYEICGEKTSFLSKINEALAPCGVTMTTTPTSKCGVRGTSVQVSLSDIPQGSIRDAAYPPVTWDKPSVQTAIRSLPLPPAVCDDAAAILALLWDAQAAVQGTTHRQNAPCPQDARRTAAEVIGCALLLHMINPEQILSSPIHLGGGFVRSAGGVLPVPSPATAELLKGIPCYTSSVMGELCTPAGSAILKYYTARFCSMPPLATTAVGYGIGEIDHEILNCVRAFLGNTHSDFTEEEASPCDDTVLSISCNLDDMTGEALGLATEILIASGALDVYTTPIQMKKNRPGILLTCLCKLEDREKFTGLFFLHTTTRGVRYQTFDRAKLESSFTTRPGSYGDIRIKKSAGYGVEKEKPEFDDLKAAVLENNCSVSLEDVVRSLHR